MNLSKTLFLALLLPACKPPESAGPAPSETPPTVPQAAAPDPRAAAPDPTKPESYVGVPLEAAEAMASAAEIPHRVVQVDGEPRAVTMDFREDRLNFTVVRGIVTGVTKG